MNANLKAVAVTLVLAALAVPARAQSVAVSGDQRITSHDAARTFGEAQSTVVAPGLKGQCPAGRLLVSNDRMRIGAPAAGLVTGRNLDHPAGPDMLATFDAPPGLAPSRLFTGEPNDPAADHRLYPRYLFSTNDHDLVSLSNGDVLYLTGAFSRAYVKTPWFSSTFRGSFGPGARSVLLTWRSTDCGETFHYSGEFDPARMEGGSCAMPQFRKDARHQKITSAPWDAGGSDGQLVHVDPATDRLYLTFSCVGYKRGPGAPFSLDPGAPLDDTLVASSDDGGASWHSLGFFPRSVWRLPVLPVAPGLLAFGVRDGALLAKRAASGTYVYAKDYTESPDAAPGWPGFPVSRDTATNTYIDSNVWASTIAARTPGTSDFFIAYPSAAAGKGFGYRIVFYDRAAGRFTDTHDDLLPASGGTNDFLFHLTAIDSGAGPVLLYWYDVDSSSNTATVRGRFVLGSDLSSSDFAISPPFKLRKSGPPADWYGDYNTAGGFRHTGPGLQGGSGAATDHYYPIWIEPYGVVHFAAVRYTERGAAPNLTVRRIPPLRSIAQRTIPLANVPLSAISQEHFTEH